MQTEYRTAGSRRARVHPARLILLDPARTAQTGSNACAEKGKASFDGGAHVGGIATVELPERHGPDDGIAGMVLA